MFYNPLLWMQSYMLEFKTNGIPIDAFVFSLPPQQEDFTFPQRVNETKTFGGVVVDDYGNDTIKITLSGSTVNNSFRMIRGGAKGVIPRFVTGEEEIFTLQKKLKEYGESYSLAGKQTFLYELSFGAALGGNKWWQVWVQDLQIKRDRNSPFAYNYTLSMIGNPETIQKTNILAAVLSVIDEVRQIIGDSISALNTFARMFVDIFKAAFNDTKILTGFVDDILETLLVFKDLNENMCALLDSTGQDIKEQYTTTLQGLVNDLKDEGGSGGNKLPSKDAGLVLYNTAKDIQTKTKDFSRALKAYIDEGKNEKTSEAVVLGAIKQMSGLDTDDLFNMLSTMENACDTLVTSTKRLGDFTPFVSDGQVYIAQSYTGVKVKKGMTWDGLAQEYLGSADKAGLLIDFNVQCGTFSIANGDIPPIGDIVLIPSFETKTTQGNTDIRNNPGVKDNLGIDMLLDNQGDFAVQSGDFSTITSENNLLQSVNNRLAVLQGALVREPYIGIAAQIGKECNKTYTRASIEQTLAGEQRIKSVDIIDIQDEAGIVRISVGYTSINGNENNTAKN